MLLLDAPAFIFHCRSGRTPLYGTAPPIYAPGVSLLRAYYIPPPGILQEEILSLHLFSPNTLSANAVLLLENFYRAGSRFPEFFLFLFSTEVSGQNRLDAPPEFSYSK